MTQTVELRPDKNLLHPDFENYQFFAESVTDHVKIPLKADVLNVEIKPLQDSYLEARLFAYHNHLFNNAYDNTCWFITNNGSLMRFNLDGDLEQVCSLEDFAENSTYNPTIVFGSRELVILSNGAGKLNIVVFKNNKYFQKSIFDISPGVVLDALLVEKTSTLVVVLCNIEEHQDKKCSKIYVQSFDANLMKLRQELIIVVRGFVECALIESSGEYLNIIAQDHVEFPLEKPKQQLNIPKYSWSQDETSITVYLKIPKNSEKSDVKVDVLNSALCIKVKDVILIKGDLSHRLEPNLMTWEVKDGLLEIELYKLENGLMWNELMIGNEEGEYIPNKALADVVHSRLAHLCSDKPDDSSVQPALGFNSEQLEECDLQSHDTFLQRVNLSSNSVTHLTVLGSSNKLIFFQRESFGHSICLRYDHHGCLWKSESSEASWQLKHVHTYPGLGYIEASKTNKKFCIHPPNGSYVAIVEHKKHVFLYEKPDVSSRVAKQSIYYLDEELPLLGAVALDKYLILLTKKTLHLLQVNFEIKEKN